MRLSTASWLAFLIVTVSMMLADAMSSPAAPVLHLERMVPLNSSLVAVEHHRARDRARHARLFSGLLNFSVYGSADSFFYGIYFTRVKLGTPAREFNLQIDTGSDLAWVNSKSCPSCPRSSRFGVQLNSYDVADSSTAKVLPCADKLCTAVSRRNATLCSSDGHYCGYKINYMDGATTTGFYVGDVFHFESVPSGSMTSSASAGVLFGVSTYRSGILALTDLAVDRMLGFGKTDLSVVSQLYYRGITPRVFSHCLKSGGTGGGVFVLGEVSAPGFVYTSLVPSQPHYSLYLQSIEVNGKLLPVDPRAFAPSANRATFVDTRTTLAYLVTEAYDEFVRSVSATVSTTPIISHGFHCYAISSRVFPEVSLNFAGNASMTLKPEDYLILSNDGSMWCLGFLKSPGLNILGDLVIKDKIFVYDLVRGRVGWVDYDCSSPVNVSASDDDFFNPKRSSSSSSSRNLLFQLLSVAIVAAFLSI